MRTKKRSKDQLRAIHASYANGYIKKGYRKKSTYAKTKKSKVRPHKRIVRTTVVQKQPNKKNNSPKNNNAILKKKALQEIGEDELWQIEHGNYYTRSIDDLNKGLIPSRESFDRIVLSFELNPNKYLNRFIDEYTDLDNFSDDDKENEYFNLLNQAEKGNVELQEKFINLLDNYHAEYDDELEQTVAVADYKAVNTGYSHGAPDLRYRLFMEGMDIGENIAGDGELVQPTKIVAIYDENEKRYLTAQELSKIKFSDKGEQPSIKQLEKNN